MLASAKSPRVRYDCQLINWEANHSWIQGSFRNEEVETLELGIIAGEKDTNLSTKRYLVNRVSRTQRDFIQKFRAVLFTPEDIKLVLGNPSRRRTYLDTILTQTSSEYYQSTKDYQLVVRQRNKLLKLIREGKQGPDQLKFWNGKLIKLGTIIHQYRHNFFSFCEKKLPALSKQIFREGTLTLPYQPNIATAEKLETYSKREIMAGTSLIGPHRDDFAFTLSFAQKTLANPPQQGKTTTTSLKRNLDIYGSRGQQRLATLALKICEYEFLHQDYDQQPLLLLDDIFSELDPEHQRLVLGLLDRGQAMVTTTSEELIPPPLRRHWQVIHLDPTKN